MNAAEQTVSGGYVLLRFDEICLSLPQSSVNSVAVSSDMQSTDESDEGHALGVINSDSNQWPVFALSNEMELLLELPRKRKFCVCIGDDPQAAFALACESLEPMRLVNGTVPQPLPECMRGPLMPLEGIVVQGESVVFVANPSALLSYFNSVGVCHDRQQ